MIEITSNADQLAAAVLQVPTGILASLRESHQRVGIGLAAYVQKEKLSGQALQVRTGASRRAIVYRVVEEAGSGEIATIVSGDLSRAPGLRAQEYGAPSIVPRRAKYLTIPLEPARTATGVARFSARQFLDNPEAYGFTRGFVNRKRTAILGVRDTGPGGFDDDSDVQVEAVFALKKSITLKPVGFFSSTLRERTEWIRAQFAEAFRRGLDFGGGGAGAAA